MIAADLLEWCEQSRRFGVVWLMDYQEQPFYLNDLIHKLEQLRPETPLKIISKEGVINEQWRLYKAFQTYDVNHYLIAE